MSVGGLSTGTQRRGSKTTDAIYIPNGKAERICFIPLKLVVRLSFLTSEDQSRFEQLFRSAAGGENGLGGDRARDILMRSKLPAHILSKIWYGDILEYTWT